MELGDGSAADFNLITYTLAAAFLGLFLLVSVLKSRKRDALRSADTQQTGKPGIKLYVFIAVAMVTLYVADYFNALASGKLAVEILVPLSYIFSMPMTLASDVIIFKEKFTLRSAIGLAMVIAAAVLTNI